MGLLNAIFNYQEIPDWYIEHEREKARRQNINEQCDQEKINALTKRVEELEKEVAQYKDLIIDIIEKLFQQKEIK